MLGFFAFTARDQRRSSRTKPADVSRRLRQAVGVGLQLPRSRREDVYSAGVQAHRPVTTCEAELPTLYLPVDKKVEIELESRDVIHSFWVIDFLYKKDMIPGKTNYMR